MKFDVDPFEECTTIASTCMHVPRKKFFKSNKIGIVRARGYRVGDNQSIKAIKWLLWMETGV